MSDDTDIDSSDTTVATNTVHTGDASEVLQHLPPSSTHAVVTDPPYGMGFMERDWDSFGDDTSDDDDLTYREWCASWGDLARRIVKPGGHVLAFGGSRTHHHLMAGLEDAGLELRDTITYHYGDGFPKPLDVAKEIDSLAGEEGELGGPKTPRHRSKIENGGSQHHEGYERAWMNDPDAVEKNAREYHPATDDAQRWDGWMTELKPATEFIVVARVPLAEDTIAANVRDHGVGAFNVDACRIERSDDGGHYPGPDTVTDDATTYSSRREGGDGAHPDGRYPSNVAFDSAAAADLARRTDTSAERYFYTSRATTAEKTRDGAITNDHPTVKPVDLMEWLVQLVTREGQLVVDPFAGSGTTGVACRNTGCEFALVEQDPVYADVARARVGLEPDDPSRVRTAPESQLGLEAFGGGERE